MYHKQLEDTSRSEEQRCARSGHLTNAFLFLAGEVSLQLKLASRWLLTTIAP